MATFYAIETMREIASNERHYDVYDHGKGDTLFDCEKVRFFFTKKERDAFVNGYNRQDDICIDEAGEEVSRTVWTVRAVNRAEAVKAMRERPYLYDRGRR